MNNCKANKFDGTRCKKKATSSGYCNIHDPDEIKKREVLEKEEEKRRKPLYDFLNVIAEVLRDNDWGWTTNNIDKNNYTSACLSIYKYFDSSVRDKTTAILHIHKNKENSFSYQIEKTSFHNFGIEALYICLKDAFDRNGYVKTIKKENTNNYDDILKTIFLNFDLFAKQLLIRYKNRNTIKINDEYDIQDLIYAILRLFFCDIRREEYVPSYAGSNSRVDFFLNNEKILIEIKMARSNLSDKELGEQLIIDKERYKIFPKCKYIYCFVYNPLLSVKNPNGIESDLSEKLKSHEFKVFIYPK
jgi:hypothetical protein